MLRVLKADAPVRGSGTNKNPTTSLVGGDWGDALRHPSAGAGQAAQDLAPQLP